MRLYPVNKQTNKQTNHLRPASFISYRRWPTASLQTASARIVWRHSYRIRRNMNCLIWRSQRMRSVNAFICWGLCAVCSWQVARNTFFLLFVCLIMFSIFQPVEGRIMNSFMNREWDGTWNEMNVNKPDIYLQRLRTIKDIFRKFWVVEPRTSPTHKKNTNILNHNAFIMKDMNIFVINYKLIIDTEITSRL